MSPAHAAPSTASVTAWQTTSASECPSAPLSRRNRHAAEDQRPPFDQAVEVVAGADALTAGTRAPARRARLEIAGGRDLHVRRIALDDVDPVPGLLGEHRFVGRLHARAAQRDRRAQDVAPERLRRLREIDLFARESSPTMTAADPLAPRASPCRCAGSAAIAAPCSTAASIAREIRSGRDERPCGIVHEHTIRRRARHDRSVGHRILPRAPPATTATRAAASRATSAEPPTASAAAPRRSRRSTRSRPAERVNAALRESSGPRCRATASARRRRAGGRRPPPQ